MFREGYGHRLPGALPGRSRRSRADGAQAVCRRPADPRRRRPSAAGPRFPVPGPTAQESHDLNHVTSTMVGGTGNPLVSLWSCTMPGPSFPDGLYPGRAVHLRAPANSISRLSLTSILRIACVRARLIGQRRLSPRPAFPGCPLTCLPGVYPGHAGQRYASELLLTATNMPVLDGFGADKIG